MLLKKQKKILEVNGYEWYLSDLQGIHLVEFFKCTICGSLWFLAHPERGCKGAWHRVFFNRMGIVTLKLSEFT